MKFKKTKPFISLVFLFIIMSLPILAGAQTELPNPLGEGVTLEAAVKNIINAALGITGVLALIAFIYGGITWMISGGDSAKVQKGKNMMIWAVWGIVIIFSSYAILNYIFGALVSDGGDTGRIGSDTSLIRP